VAVEAVIDGLIANVGADTRINGFFADSDLVVLDMMLVDQVCEATGGYCTYKGEDMVTAHTGMGITDDEFNYLVEDLLMALDTLGVPYTPGTFDGGVGADTLIQVLAGMRGDIVGK
jgi:hemoglobin